MAAILLNWRQLRSRGSRIRKILQPIARQKGGPAWQPKQSPGNYIIGTHDGSPPQSDHREWRFATVVNNFRACYFEVWRHHSAASLYLYRAYLSIFQTDIGPLTEREFLCLHCDPNESERSEHAIYKKGPHLHIQAADPPIPHAHIALNRCHLEQVLSSEDSLTEAFGLAVIMLKEEILDAM